MSLAAFYRRVSSEDQGKSLSPESQLEICRELASRYGYGETDDYADLGISGRTVDERPEFKRLLKAVARGKYEAVLARDSDRITRNADDWPEIKRAFRAGGAVLITLGGVLDLDNITQEFTSNVQIAVADYQRKVMRANCAAGIDAYRRTGRPWGPTPPYGYRFEGTGRDRRLVVDEDEAKLVRLVVELAREQSQLAVLRDLRGRGFANRDGRPFSAINVRRIISPERLRFYAGEIKGPGGELVPGFHEPLISRKLAAEVGRAVPGRNPARVSGRRPALLFTGLGIFRCAYCGATMNSYRDGKRKRRYYGCSGPKRGYDCRVYTFDAERLEAAVVEDLFAKLALPLPKFYEAYLAQQKAGDNGLPRLEKRRTSLERKLENLVRAVAEGTLEPADIKRQRTLIVSDLQDVEREIAERQGAPADVVKLDEIKNLRKAARHFGELPRPEQRELVSLTVAEMKAYGKTKRVKIKYRFPIGESGERDSTVRLGAGNGGKG
jgi:site-specific DNA recombinase